MNYDHWKTTEPDPWEFDEIDEDEDEMAEAEMNCSMMPDGQCGQAGSEYCDFECPFRH